MFGVDMFIHTVRLVLNNLAVAIRILAVLMLVQIAVSRALGWGNAMAGLPMMQTGQIDAGMRMGALAMGGGLLVPLGVVAGLVAKAAALVLGQTLGMVWSFPVQWAGWLTGASILTTISGHYVEGHALNG